MGKIKIAYWLGGIWASMLGFRYMYELLKSGAGTYIMIPAHPVNIYFDFLILGVLGSYILYKELSDWIRDILRMELGGPNNA